MSDGRDNDDTIQQNADKICDRYMVYREWTVVISVQVHAVTWVGWESIGAYLNS